jgi:HEAT repeat protein
MDGSEVIARLEAPAGDEQAVFDELRDTAPSDAVIEALVSARDPWTRMLVADMLGQRAEPSARDALVAALDDEDEQVRRAAADALRKLGPDGNAGAALLARYDAEGDPKVRRALASALGAARYEPAAGALRAALAGDDPALAVAAKQGLHRIEGAPPLSPEEVVEALKRPTDDGWSLMGQLLADAPTEVLVDALARAADASTRRALADLLGFRGDASGAEPLAGLLDDPDDAVRAAAADALGKVFMADPPPPPDVARRVGAAMLTRFEAEQSLPVLTTLASALGATRYEPALPALRAARESGERSLARQAAWGLHWLEGTPPPS